MPPPKCSENTYVTNHRKRKNHVIPRSASDVGISRGNVGFSVRGDEWYGPPPWPLGFRWTIPCTGRFPRRFAPRNDIFFHVYNISLPLRNHNVVGGGTPPALHSFRNASQDETREGQDPPLRFCCFALSHSTGGLHHRHSLRSPHQCAHWFAMT